MHLLAALGLHCSQAFFSCGEQGLFFAVVSKVLIAVASLVAGAQALELWSFSSGSLRAQ